MMLNESNCHQWTAELLVKTELADNTFETADQSSTIKEIHKLPCYLKYLVGL